MLTVEDYARIRRTHRDGMSIHEIARRYRHSRRTIRQALRSAEPEPYTRRKPAPAPKLGAFHGIIDEILKADEAAPPKQRHTATLIFEWLKKEHGYQGGYGQVRRYVAASRRIRRETFLPLEDAPGQRMEADFGHIHVDFPEGRRLVPVLLLTWAHSYRVFALALPTERVEAILHGMRSAFEFFGCVPQEVWWDNPTTVATTILVGRERKLHPRYLALASHYNFEPLFCMPARGNEKPHVENRVKHLQRRWATPVPQVQNLAELNEHLRRCCLEDLERVATGQQETIGARFQQDLAGALSLPERPFDPCVSEAKKVDKYQTVAFDKNRYSAPRAFAFRPATAKGYVDAVEIVVEGQVVARHARSYARGEYVLDPQHYLAILGRKPAYLDHTRVFREWRLPGEFDALRRELEESQGGRAGARQFVRVLQLLGEHPLERVQQAIASCRAAGRASAELVIQRTEHLRQRALSTGGEGEESDSRDPLPQVHVPAPDLKRFDAFLLTGGLCDGEIPRSFLALKDEPQAAAAAKHAGGV